MKNPIIPVVNYIFTNLGEIFTVDGTPVFFSSDVPDNPPTNYVWCDVTGTEDVGTKETFLSRVNLDLVCVSKVTTDSPSSLFVNKVGSYVTELLINRGERNLNLLNDFALHEIMLNSQKTGVSNFGQVQENFLRLSLEFLVEQL